MNGAGTRIRLSLPTIWVAWAMTFAFLPILCFVFFPLICENDQNAFYVTVFILVLLLCLWICCILTDNRNSVWGNEQQLFVKKHGRYSTLSWSQIDSCFCVSSIVKVVVLVVFEDGAKQYIRLVYNKKTKDLIKHVLSSTIFATSVCTSSNARWALPSGFPSIVWSFSF